MGCAWAVLCGGGGWVECVVGGMGVGRQMWCSGLRSSGGVEGATRKDVEELPTTLRWREKFWQGEEVVRRAGG